MLPQWTEFSEEEERLLDEINAQVRAKIEAKREHERLRVLHHNEFREQRRHDRDQEHSR